MYSELHQCLCLQFTPRFNSFFTKVQKKRVAIIEQNLKYHEQIQMIMSFSAYKYKYELHESVYRLDVLGYKYAFNYFIAIRMDFVVTNVFIFYSY